MSKPQRKLNPPTEQSVEAAIAALPFTPESIAQFLRERGIKGLRAESTSCPLAQYFKQTCGDAPSVTYSGLSINTRHLGIFSRRKHFQLNGGYRQFIQMFDSRHFPDLEV